MSGRDWLAGLVGGAQQVGQSLNRRRDLREADARRKSEREAAQQDALALIAARAKAEPSSARNPVTVWAGDDLLQFDDATGEWVPAMLRRPSDAPPSGDAAMGDLVGAAVPRTPVTRPAEVKPAPVDPPIPAVVDGKVVYVPRSQAVGKEAPRPQSEPNLVTGVGPDGKPVRVVDRPGVIMPSAGTTDKPATDAERIAAGFADRMALAATTLERLEQDPSFTPELTSPIRSPSGGGALPMVGNWMLSTNGQLYKQAQDNWVRANLRKESGAAISDQERESEIKSYFPQPGDDPAVIAAKAKLRKVAEANMRRNAGRAGQQYSPDNPFAKPPV